MRPPFERAWGELPGGRIGWIAAGALLSGAALLVLDQDLRTDASPLGIVSFELAFDPGAARAMVRAWEVSPRGARAAGLSLGLDYLFMLLYAVGLSMLAARVASRFDAAGRPRALGALAAWGLLAAGLFDAVENAGLIAVFLGGGGGWAAPLAGVCASLKFALLGLGGLYLLVGVVATIGR